MLSLGDKPAVKSITIASAAVIAAVQAAEGCGVVPPGTLHYLAVAAQSLAVLFFGYGLRRAVSANGLGAALDILDAADAQDAFDESEDDFVGEGILPPRNVEGPDRED